MAHASPSPVRSGATRLALVLLSLGLSLSLGLAPALPVLPAQLAAQEPGAVVGQVLEQGLGTPVADAVVTLFQVVDGASEPRPVGTAVTDEEGVFSLRPPGAGRFQVAADYNGLSSALSPPFEVSASGATGRHIVLELPSRLLMLAATCEAGDPSERQAGAVVVGVLRDQGSHVPLPGARVEARWLDAQLGEREQITETDASGRYRICGVTVPSELRLRAEMLGRSGGWGALAVPRAAVVVHDLAFSLATATVSTDEPMDWGVATADDAVAAAEGVEGAVTATLGDLSGVLLDRFSGEPVPSAVLRLRGTGFQGITDGAGAFAFNDLLPGVYTLEVRHLGYAVEARELEVPAGRVVRLALRLSPEALELDEIEVVARSAAEQVIRTTPFRRYVVHGDDLAREEERGARVADILRSRMLGLRVLEGSGVAGSQLCVETSRRIIRLQVADSLTQRGGTAESDGQVACAMVQLVVDGARVGDSDGRGSSDILRSLSVADVESLEFLPPSHATLTYGVGGNVANGVLVIYTRGKGPYRSAARDPTPRPGGEPEGDP